MERPFSTVSLLVGVTFYTSFVMPSETISRGSLYRKIRHHKYAIPNVRPFSRMNLHRIDAFTRWLGFGNPAHQARVGHWQCIALYCNVMQCIAIPIGHWQCS